MKLSLAAAAAAVLIAASCPLYAQPAPSQPVQKPASGMDRMHDHTHGEQRRCATPDDPKACDAERQKIRAAMEKAHESCKAVPGNERRGCMQTSLCAQAPDPTQCNARESDKQKRRDERHVAMEKARAACKGKEGDDLKQCLRDQRPRHSPASTPHEPKH